MSKRIIEYKYLVAITYVCVSFLDRMDVTIVNVAMSTFADIFKVKVTETEWISTGFLLALAIIIPISGWAGDKFGTKKIFIIATTIFTLGSLLCAFAWSLEALVVFRILQGIGGGMVIPIGMAMTYRAFPATEYSKAASYTLMPTLIAPAIAPTLGGFILENFSWRWIFLINVPIGVSAVVMSFLFLKEDKLENTPTLDWIGFMLSAVGLSVLLYTLSRVGHYGLSDHIVWAGTIVTLISFTTFVFWEKSVRHPLIDIKFFKIPLFVQANIIQLSLHICHIGSIFLVALYFQVGLGMTPIQSGLAMCTQPIGSIMMLPISARVFNKFGPKYSIMFGLLGLSITTYFIFLIKSPNDVLLAALLLWVRGLVIGFANGPVQASALFDIKRVDTGRASSIFNAGRQVAISFGVALSSLVLASGFRELNINTNALTANSNSLPIFERAFIMLALISFLGVLVAITINNKRILEIVGKKK
jgi:EmrB/QacA subfamily drug resistance transporter